MKYVKPTSLLAGLLIAVGLISIVYFRDQQTAIVTPPPKAAELARARATAPVVTQANDNPVVSGEPVALSVPSVGIDIQVTPGVYNDQTRQWTLTADKAQFAVNTARPNNQSGNTFIYGHYRKGVFSTLHKLTPGSKAIVTTDNGKTFTYVLERTKIVTPDQTDEVFGYQGAPILTLQTCTGLFFENRQLFFFSLEGVS